MSTFEIGAHANANSFERQKSFLVGIARKVFFNDFLQEDKPGWGESPRHSLRDTKEPDMADTAAATTAPAGARRAIDALISAVGEWRPGEGAPGMGTVLQPMSHRAPRARRDAARVDLVGQVLAAMPGGASAGPAVKEAAASFADRIRLKQAQRAFRNVAGMSGAAGALASKTADYNLKARELDPGLFREVSALALKTRGPDGRPVTEREVLDRVLDTRAKEPSLNAIRQRLRSLADHPELAGARLQLQSLAATFERSASGLAVVARNLSASDARAVAQLVAAVEAKLAPAVGAVGKLDVETPSESPNSGRNRVQGAFDDFCTDMHGMARDLDGPKRPEQDGPDGDAPATRGPAPSPGRRGGAGGWPTGR